MPKLLLRSPLGDWVTPLVCIFYLCHVASSQPDVSSVSVELKSDEPAVVGAPVGFYAQLRGLPHAGNASLYTFDWNSKAIGFKQRMDNQSTQCNVTVPSVKYEGVYYMKVAVWQESVQVAKASVSFRITTFINGYIKISQAGTQAVSPNYVSTNSPANVSLVLHDPHNFFNNTFIYYGWGIDSATLPTFGADFSYNFSSASGYHLMCVVTVIYDDHKPSIYMGSFSEQVVAKNPIIMSNVSGNTSIQHGDMLDIEITCTGSTPLSYCWYFEHSYINSTNLTCAEPMLTDFCDFNIIRYIKKSGNYKLVLIVGNDVDHKVNIYNINVYQRGAEPQLSPIIVPLACSSVALAIVVVGIMYYIQSRRNYTVEVADFDFQHSDNYEFHTFGERMVKAFKVWCGRAQNRQQKSTSYRRILAQIT